MAWLHNQTDIEAAYNTSHMIVIRWQPKLSKDSPDTEWTALLFDWHEKSCVMKFEPDCKKKKKKNGPGKKSILFSAEQIQLKYPENLSLFFKTWLYMWPQVIHKGLLFEF